MYRKVLITGVTAAAILGAGGTALALSGSDTTPGKASASSSSTGSSSTAKHNGHGKDGKGKQGKGKLLRRLSHGQIVVKGKDGKFVTHDLIKGKVTAVSATSISVVAADKTSETFSVSKDTKVRVRSAGKGAASTIDKVAKGDDVLVAGTGTSNFAALHVIDVKGTK